MSFYTMHAARPKFTNKQGYQHKCPGKFVAIIQIQTLRVCDRSFDHMTESWKSKETN